MKNCKEIETKTKVVITKERILYGKQYKCKLKSGKFVSSMKLCCERCPKQYELFKDNNNERRYNR